jgi:hypothetical protein
MGQRRVRTAAGATRYGKPIGSVIARGVSVGRGENIVSRARQGAGARARQQRTDVKAVKQLYDFGFDPGLTKRQRELTQYQGPKAAAAKRATGQNLKPKAESLAAARGRRATQGRTVAANPLSGRLVAQSGQQRVPVKRASAGRAVAARRTPKPAYVGRRRRED